MLKSVATLLFLSTAFLSTGCGGGSTGTTAPTTGSGNNDLTAPTVAMSAPSNGATLSGIVPVSATASDNVGVVGVQFLMDGSPLGAEVTVAPYSTNWNTTTTTKGTHSLAARARDAATNQTTSAAVMVTVSNNVTIAGRLISNPSGNPIASAQITDTNSGMTLATTDGSGTFSFQYDGLSSPIQVTLQAAGHMTRLTRIARTSHSVTIDLISQASPFDLTYYRQLARNAVDLNGSLASGGLLVWPRNPSFYIRTNLVDPGQNFSDTGKPVPGHAIDLTVSGIPVIVSEVTAGRLQPGSIEMGSGLKHWGESGWIVIQFFDRGTNPQPYSGTGGNWGIGAQVWGSVIVGVYTSPPSGFFCSSGISQGLIFHETGHALGLFHIPPAVDSPNIMGGGLGATCDVVHFSGMERFHSAIMYSRPRGNLDADIDPPDLVF